MNRSRAGWAAPAALGLLVAAGACALAGQMVGRAASPLPYPPSRTLRLGPVTLLSGLASAGPCSTFGVTADKWRCADAAYAARSSQRASYRLWVIVTAPGRPLRVFNLVNVPIPPGE